MFFFYLYFFALSSLPACFGSFQFLSLKLKFKEVLTLSTLPRTVYDACKHRKSVCGSAISGSLAQLVNFPPHSTLLRCWMRVQIRHGSFCCVRVHFTCACLCVLTSFHLPPLPPWLHLRRPRTPRRGAGLPVEARSQAGEMKAAFKAARQLWSSFLSLSISLQ